MPCLHAKQGEQLADQDAEFVDQDDKPERQNPGDEFFHGVSRHLRATQLYCRRLRSTADRSGTEQDVTSVNTPPSWMGGSSGVAPGRQSRV